jgi:CBS domain-containing protein
MKAAGLAMKMEEAEVDSYIEAYHYIQMLRLRHQYEESLAGRPMNNHLNPDELNDLDRRILKESFRLSRKLQARLAMDYQV